MFFFLHASIDHRTGGMRGSGGKYLPMTMMMMLPEDLLIEILTRLQGKPLGLCKCVCKSWLSMIKSRTFFEVYRSREPSLIMYWAEEIHWQGFRLNSVYSTLRRSKESAEEFNQLSQLKGLSSYNKWEELTTEVVNGLICVRESNLRLRIYNLCTGQGMRLPDPLSCTSNRLIKFYLGYDPRIKVYKLLQLVFTNQLTALVMTLRPSNSLSEWRKLDNDGCGLSVRPAPAGVNSLSEGSVLADGFLWWLCRNYYLLSFDLNNEKFELVKVPADVRSTFHSRIVFIQSMGRPAIWVIISGCFVLFVFENDNTWSKHCVPFPQELGRVEWIVDAGNLPTGEILLMNVEFRYEDFLPSSEILPMDVELMMGEPSLRYKDYKTPVYAYNHRTNKFDRFLVGKLYKNESLYYQRGPCSKHIRRGIAKVSCLHHNNNVYLPLEDVLSGSYEFTN
ncbi:OLC1v1039101C1 [Oldenlandia corymbosa var. corymbosa]|uniref:OLC1v1039101C1 n=1 Tax=Oldenlandia corymbosa var. corymbosa TaxID=529605 RepID=A0AAV1D3Y9_OLDCO|nr:OLC1v1039101C1 [Oldenlandia corymbosa var. corymbosa]